MNNQLQTHIDEPACPMALVVLPAIIGALVWLCVILPRIAH